MDVPNWNSRLQTYHQCGLPGRAGQCSVALSDPSLADFGPPASAFTGFFLMYADRSLQMAEVGL